MRSKPLTENTQSKVVVHKTTHYLSNCHNNHLGPIFTFPACERSRRSDFHELGKCLILYEYVGITKLASSFI